MDNNEKAILKTLLYSDIFHFPLTSKEIWFFLISANLLSERSVKKYIMKCTHITSDGVYYALKGRQRLIKERKKNVMVNEEKMKLIQHISRWLFSIPTIYFIGVSGSVAMQNAVKEDDIDIFVITQKNTVWISRLLLLIIMELLGVRRKKSDACVANKVCLNMIIDESHMVTPRQKQDIYIAHEIVQVVPIQNRKKTYERFLEENAWVSSYLANVSTRKNNAVERKGVSLSQRLGSFLLSLSLVENVARYIQVYVMRKHITSETVSKNVLAFHPHDYRKATVKAYERKIKNYGI